jgi:uncharacterized phage infection (PIP) family protein YhgE
MKLPDEPCQNPNSDPNGADRTIDQEFEQALTEVERSLQSLKERFAQVQQAQQQQQQLQQRQAQLQQAIDLTRLPAFKAELKQIQNQLDELEVNLESRLLSWNSLKEPFWQIVRFGGLGMVIGWFLAFLTFQTAPPPMPQPAPPPQDQHS